MPNLYKNTKLHEKYKTRKMRKEKGKLKNAKEH